MPRKCRTDDELKSLSKDLFHEIDMLYWLIGWLSTDPSENRQYNATLTAFVFHAWSLHQFLYGKPGEQEDQALARDFFDLPGEWKPPWGDPTKFLEETYHRSHRRAAYLSYGRLKFEGKEWQFVAIGEALKEPLRSFARNVPRERLWEGFDLERAMNPGGVRPKDETATHAETLYSKQPRGSGESVHPEGRTHIREM